MPTIQIAVQNLHRARNAFKCKWQTYWKGMAHAIDEWARGVLPSLYVLSMLTLFNLEFSDDYASDDPSPMAQGGYLHIQLTTQGAVWTIVAMLACLLGFFLLSLFRRLYEREKEREKLDEILALRSLNKDVQCSLETNATATRGEHSQFRRGSWLAAWARTPPARHQLPSDTG